MADTLTLAASCVGAQVLGADREVKLFLSQLLSYRVDGAEYSGAFKAGHWDGRSSFYNWGTSKFPAGFAMFVHDALIAKGYKVRFVRKPAPGPRGPETFHLFRGRGTDPRYDYQADVVRQLIKHRIGIARVATGGGKSWIATLAIHRIRRPTLFLTTRGVLMYQMADGLKEAGFSVGILGDGEFTPKAINCAMVQTLAARVEDVSRDDMVERELLFILEAETEKVNALRSQLKKAKTPAAEIKRRTMDLAAALEKAREPDASIVERMTEKHRLHHIRRRKTIKLLEVIEFVIGEEAHEAGGNSYFEILKHCRNAHYRLALTATPFMRPDAEANMRLMAAFGTVIAEVSEKMLIDRGILATPYFKIVSTPKPAKLYKTTTWQRAYKIGIVENEARNREIVKHAAQAARLGLTAMVLVQHKAHGVQLLKMLKAVGMRAAYIYGEHDQNERKHRLNQLKTGEIQCLIGTTILDVGVDVPAVGMVILAGGGKAEISLRQRIGRGLREKKRGPNVALVIDFADEYNMHLRSHAQERLAILKSTPGFSERILAPGTDFDYRGLGFTLAS
ncbi:DEAD/DEAH box helicase [Roseospira marina]|uniref:DEAD/DEAH box helicase n=1 Tax=Roseospira marina TaxID=140057 RepID=A0A5M6I811_9PROT|nr:DEAD/DEAH box helicase [Roseospira marina]KAA5604414.1 DEAD/DEAH box helicase [Roseospira marina]